MYWLHECSAMLHVGVTTRSTVGVGCTRGADVLVFYVREPAQTLSRYSQRDQRGGGYLVRCAERGYAARRVLALCPRLCPRWRPVAAGWTSWSMYMCKHSPTAPSPASTGTSCGLQGALGLWVAAIASRITEEPQTEVAPCPGLLWLPRPPLHHPGRPGPFDGSLTRARYIYPAYLPHHRPS